MELLRRFWFFLNRGRLERELAEEMAEHRRQMGEHGVNFGSPLKLREDAREAWGGVWLDTLWQDLRYAARGLRRSPAFAFSAVLILSLGLGLNLALFQCLNVALLQTAPLKNAHELVRFERQSDVMSSTGHPYPATQYYRQNARNVLAAVITESGGDAAWEDNAADRIRVRYVSANLFDETGHAGAAAGRVFHESIDEKPGAPAVAVLSHAFWERRFSGRDSIIGGTIRLNGRPLTVVGVAAEAFPDLRPQWVDVYVPIHQFDLLNPGADYLTSWKSHSTDFFARLRPGLPPAAAQQAMQSAVRELVKERPGDFHATERLPASGARSRFLALRDRGPIFTAAALGAAMVLLVLLVACSNLANLVLARAQQRVAELSVRAAIGAGRARIVRQLATESVLLALVGVGGGAVLGGALIRYFMNAAEAPASLDFRPDLWTAGMAIMLALVVVVVSGVIPAWAATRGDLLVHLRAGASGLTTRGWLQKTLLGLQVTGACGLLLVAGLWYAGFQRLVAAGPGFDFAQLVALDPALSRHGVKGEAARVFWDDVKRTLAGNPAMEDLALSSHLPFGRSHSTTTFEDAPALTVTDVSVSPEYFRVLRIPLLHGRTFRPEDDRRAVIIGRRLAEAMYGTADVVGRAFPRRGAPEATVVGVAREARLISVDANNGSAVYHPLDRKGDQQWTLVARTRVEPGRALDILRGAARQADSRVLASATVLATEFDRRMQPNRLLGTAVGAMGVLALALASVGVFGLVTYTVGRRTKELGIRRALGAGDGRLMSSVLRGLRWPLAAGFGTGAALGFALAWALSGAPFYLNPNDAAGAGLSLAVLAGVTTVAAWLPARRALSVDPLRALRHD